METEGCFELVFAGGTTPAKNARAFWDPTAKKIYGAWSAGRATCGTFYEAAATDDTVCKIMINQGLVDDGENGDITGVTAGTGLSGGGTTGAVTLAVAFGATDSTACVGNDARLSDARTPSSTLAHAASHAVGQADVITPAAIGACADNDVRLTDARTPSSTLAHAASHHTAEADALAPADIGAAAASHGHAATEVTYNNVNVPPATNVSNCFDTLIGTLLKDNLTEKSITVLNTATTGASAADATLIGGRVVGVVPTAGVESAVAGVAIAGDGAITVTLAAAQAVGDGTLKVYAQISQA
jgi:hypothetical protein